MTVGDVYVFPGFLTSVLTKLFFPKPPTTFLTCFCRGERRKYAGKKSRLNKHVTLKEPSSFRWLSLEAAINAVFRCYPAIVMTLEGEAAKRVSEAKGILRPTRNISFSSKTAFLIDALRVLKENLTRSFKSINWTLT